VAATFARWGQEQEPRKHPAVRREEEEDWGRRWRPRTYLIFGDIDGKLDVLRVECTKCARKGRYSVRKLIEKYGRRANLMKWKEHTK
jgi:hypothetical protein